MLEHRVLSADEERDAIARYVALRDEHGAEHKLTVAARNRIVTANLRLVARIANKMRGTTFEDRVQEGVFGLIRALEKFEPGRGLRFSTYAAPWVRHFIGRAVDDKGDAVRVPVCARRKLLREPERAHNGAALLKGFSLDEPLTSSNDRDRKTRYDVLPADVVPADELIEQREREQAVRDAVADLDDRERAIVVARYGLDGGKPKTPTQLRRATSRERVVQVESEALSKVRAWVA